MATTAVNDDHLLVRFSWWEMLLLRRSTYEVPLDAVGEAEMHERWLPVPGARAGLIVIGLLKIGVWRSPTSSRLVCMKRGVPTMRVTVDKALSGGRFDELLISAPDIPQTYAALRAGAPR